MPSVSERWFYGALYRTGLAPWDVKGPQPSLVEAEAAGFVSGSVLDLGCGKGGNALFLAERGYAVAGIDLVPAAIGAARRLAARRGLPVSFSVGDVFDLHEAERYDTLVDFGLLHRFREGMAEAYLHKVASLANEGGRLLFQCFSDRAPGWAGLAPRRFAEADLRNLFAGEWDLRQLDRAEFRLKWGGSAPAWRGFATRRSIVS
jgi:SAM-dependent methyltransferase